MEKNTKEIGGICMYCSKCGTQISEGEKVCPSCGNSIGQPKVDTSKFTQVKNPATNYVSAEEKAQELSNKISEGNAFSPIGGIISGIISVIFGIIMFAKDVGSYEYSATYGGDAYTGIQNAAAQTANNVTALSKIAKTGFAFFLIVLGLIAIFYFAMKLGKSGDNK